MDALFCICRTRAGSLQISRSPTSESISVSAADFEAVWFDARVLVNLKGEDGQPERFITGYELPDNVCASVATFLHEHRDLDPTNRNSSITRERWSTHGGAMYIVRPFPEMVGSATEHARAELARLKAANMLVATVRVRQPKLHASV